MTNRFPVSDSSQPAQDRHQGVNFLDRLVKRSTQIAYPHVLHEPERFLRTTSKWAIAKKYLHRRLSLMLGGQLRLELGRIEKGMRVLWLYTGKSNFGDALMDMSGRALLKDAGVHLDLLTLPKLKPLFDEDAVFCNVYADVEETSGNRYDAVILNEFNHPSIRLKKRHFRKIPFVCLFQYFYGPDRNQIQFSYAAVNDVFGLGHSSTELNSMAKPYATGGADVRGSVEKSLPPDRFLTIAVGGIDPQRTYQHWDQMLHKLDVAETCFLPRCVILVGSGNGASAAQAILRHKFQHFEVRSLAGQLSILESREVIACSDLFVGCDGGLMHVAHSTETPSVTLFAQSEPMHLRLTERCNSEGIQSAGDVSGIAQEKIVSAILKKLSRA